MLRMFCSKFDAMFLKVNIQRARYNVSAPDLQLSPLPVYHKLWLNSMQYSENMVSNHTEGLERVKNDDNYIYLAEISGVSSVVYKDCDYALGKERFFPSSFAWVFPENSPLLPALNKQ